MCPELYALNPSTNDDDAAGRKEIVILFLNMIEAEHLVHRKIKQENVPLLLRIQKPAGPGVERI